jgi:acetyltransferase
MDKHYLNPHRHAGRPGADPGRPGHHCAAPGEDVARPSISPAASSAARLVISTGINADAGRRAQPAGTPPRHVPAWPELPGLPAPALQAQCQRGRPDGRAGPLALVSQSGALTASILDWASRTAWASRPWSRSARTPRSTCRRCWTSWPTMPADAQHPGLHGRHPQRAPLHERAAGGGLCQAGGGDEGRPQARRQQGRADALGRHRRQRRRVRRRLRRAGAVRVRSFTQLFSAAKCLASRYRPVGKRLAIVTNGGGPGVLAADWASEIGLDVAAARRPAAPRRWQAAVLPAPGLAVRPDRPGRGRHRPSTTAPRWRPASKDRRSTACCHLFAQGRRRPGGVAEGRGRVLARHRQAGAGLLDGRCLGAAKRARLLNAAHAELPHARGGGGRLRQHRQLLPEPAAAAADAAAAVHPGQPDIEGARLLIESVLAERRKVLTEMEQGAAGGLPHPGDAHHAGAQRQRGHADRQPAGLPGGAEDRLARHQPQVRRAGRGAERHEAPRRCATPTTTCCRR